MVFKANIFCERIELINKTILSFVQCSLIHLGKNTQTHTQKTHRRTHMHTDMHPRKLLQKIQKYNDIYIRSKVALGHSYVGFVMNQSLGGKLKIVYYHTALSFLPLTVQYYVLESSTLTSIHSDTLFSLSCLHESTPINCLSNKSI